MEKICNTIDYNTQIAAPATKTRKNLSGKILERTLRPMLQQSFWRLKPDVLFENAFQTKPGLVSGCKPVCKKQNKNKSRISAVAGGTSLDTLFPYNAPLYTLFLSHTAPGHLRDIHVPPKYSFLSTSLAFVWQKLNKSESTIPMRAWSLLKTIFRKKYQ